MRVVLPHLVIGNLAQIHPHRRSFVSLAQVTGAIIRPKNSHVQLVTIEKLKKQFSHLLEIQRRHADFFLRLANRRRQRSLTLLDPTSRPIDLAGAKPTLLADQQNLTVPDDKAQIGILSRTPTFPVHALDGCLDFAHRVHPYSTAPNLATLLCTTRPTQMSLTLRLSQRHHAP